jgi:hypothetical protein
MRIYEDNTREIFKLIDKFKDAITNLYGDVNTEKIVV